MVPVREFLPMFSVLWCHGVRSFMVSCLIFMSLSPFEFIFVYGARVGSNFIHVHAAIQLFERYFCHIREIQGGTSIMGWQVSKELTEAPHDRVRFKCLPRLCFVTGFFVCLFVFGHAMRQVGSQFPDQGSNLHPLYWQRGVVTTGLPGKSLCFVTWKDQNTSSLPISTREVMRPPLNSI